ncbi:hypothetical protein [Lactococcus lactis]|uniref:hypothetical protein n=1 Tax=Lactococcus lactis TaxID=1358 RepID=UPI0024A83135|nr:hypothetical protein [Lactococcus lactis]
MLVADYKQSDVFVAYKDNLGLKSISSKKEIPQTVENTYLEILNRQESFNDFEGDKLVLTICKPLFLDIRLNWLVLRQHLIKKSLSNSSLNKKNLLGRALSVFYLITIQQFYVKDIGGHSECK